MCGRFALETVQEIYTRFNVENRLPYLSPRYNIAPGQEVPVIVRKSPNQVVLMKWGLIPHWAKDPKIGYKMINARAETISIKPSFKSSLKNRRCLIPANGFYDWYKSSIQKVPYYVTLKEDSLFGLAGLYDIWKEKDGKEIYSFTIITVPANELLMKIHNRMPVILKKEDEDIWLDKELNDEKKLNDLLKPYDFSKMKDYQVSDLVNKASVDNKELIKPLNI